MGTFFKRVGQGIHLGKTTVVGQEIVRIIKYGMIMGKNWEGRESRFEQLEK